jgi:hypothetical protein
MGIERFIWTIHAGLRLDQRGFTRFEVEEAVREGNSIRLKNQGDADWRVYGIRSDGWEFAVVYDSPVRGDARAACVVSFWRLREDHKR